VTRILAIDPGISGAVAFYQREANYVEVYDMPLLDGDVDPHELVRLISGYKPDLAVIEKVHPHPKEGVSSVWRFAAAYTTARVCIMLCKVQCILVSPTMWKNRMGLKGGKDGKEQSRSHAVMTFPEQQGQFARKKDHNRAEAALLAVYAANTLIHRNPSP